VLAEDFLTRWEPVTELTESEHVILDTERALDANAKMLKARVPTWPDGLSA
jgi:hypothetical protein